MDLAEDYARIRAATLSLTEGLSEADQTVQSMEDASPTKWHLAHTTWFFERFVLAAHDPAYTAFDPAYDFLFNSYYVAAGPRHARPRRGLLTRPALADIHRYRAHIDAAMARLLARGGRDVVGLTILGLNHEQQHQELILTDILHLFAQSPLRPAYTAEPRGRAIAAAPDDWLEFPGGLAAIGYGRNGFCYDNELPVHDVLLRPYRLARALVTNADWLRFMADDGYRRPELWLSDGWATVEREGWSAPGYWELAADGAWHQMTLYGLQPVVPERPVSHISFYEADAYARWAGHRLPLESEWEQAAVPLNGAEAPGLTPVHHVGVGAVWQWTASAYTAYPGYRPAAGAIGEYNGKFMANQMVLRGGSCLTPEGHSRPSYRNFFYPFQRWQMTGLRLADDV